MREKTKAKYWSAICYPENMIDNWKDEIGDLLELPYCYAVHDSDLDGKQEERKVHVHLIIVFPNTTTYNNALNVVLRLSAPGRICCSTIQQIINIRHMYDYLIHDTDDCRKKGKMLYDKNCRITGNNFDIGAFEVLDLADKDRIVDEISSIILEKDIFNYADLYLYSLNNMDTSYRHVIKSYSGHFDRLCKGVYLRIFKGRTDYNISNDSVREELKEKAIRDYNTGRL